MATSRLQVEIKSKWWLPVYIKTLTLFCLMMRYEPDYRKVGDFIVKHGISQKLKREPVKR
ncbi:hypothetical protein [Citrobacter koseri]|uniref:hypothetical protein n=1 Tax=Citrobacter koseri TaxID=545 RepID=UPI001907CC98|nr:hypothetical protein [Citrobacter koseri]MBJ8812608.1 hypothetical protein [Citrobacter koseri]